MKQLSRKPKRCRKAMKPWISTRVLKTVLPMDSISIVDFDDYIDDLERWKEHCRIPREN